MTNPHRSIVARLNAWPDSPEAADRPDSWVGDPAVGHLLTAGQAARSAAEDPAIFAALAARTGEPLAQTAALHAVAVELRPTVARWMRGGLRDDDLDDAEADLIAAAVELIKSRPGLTAAAMARTAWHRASAKRATERRRTSRHAPWDGHRPAAAVEPGAGLVLTAAGLAAVATLLAPGQSAGCSATATSTRRWRARQTLLRELRVD